MPVRPSRRRVVARALAAALLAGAVACSDGRPPKNIVLIVVDTLRRDHLSPYGADLETPNVEALADRGQVFRNLLASFHQTTMSMGALFSGRTPSIESEDPAETLQFNGRTWCGMSRFSRTDPRRYKASDGCMPREVETLPERLQRAGWFTAGVVSNRLLFAPAGFERGFDVWREVGASPEQDGLDRAERMALRSAPRVLDAVGAALAKAPRERVFLYVHYVDVHDWIPTGRGYAESVEAFDADLGRLLEALAGAGLLDDAVVLLTSDHGEALGERHAIPGRPNHLGNPSFQSVLEVPLIVAPPIAADADATLRSQDLRGLVERVAGLPPEPAPPATLLLPDELLLTERRYLTYQRGRWKSVLHRRDPARFVLFDLYADPGETVDQTAARPEVASEHRSRIAELRASLSAAAVSGEDLTDLDRSRLRALGYLE